MFTILLYSSNLINAAIRHKDIINIIIMIFSQCVLWKALYCIYIHTYMISQGLCIEALKELNICILNIYNTLHFNNIFLIWISHLEFYASFLSLSGELWMKAPLRHLRKSLVNHCKTFLRPNLSDKCEPEAEQVQMSTKLSKCKQAEKWLVHVSTLYFCFKHEYKASGIKMSWKQSIRSKLRSGHEHYLWC